MVNELRGKFISRVIPKEKHILNQEPDTMKVAIHMILKIAQNVKGKMKPTSQSRFVQIVQSPVLPLIPIFSGLTAFGGAIGIANAANNTRSAKNNYRSLIATLKP